MTEECRIGHLFMCLLFMLVGIIKLRACKYYKNKFEQGMINEFTVEAVDLGELKKLRIGHDNSGECTHYSFLTQWSDSFR